MSLHEWCKEQKLRASLSDGFCTIEGGETYRVLSKPHFNRFFEIEDTSFRARAGEAFVFPLGNRYYYNYGKKEVKPTLFAGLGKARDAEEGKLKTYLGVHGGYDIGKGVGQYKDWAVQAKFYGYERLGICESSLRGVLLFVKACQAEGIKPIVGMTLQVKDYLLHVFARNNEGWRQLLFLNHAPDLTMQDLRKCEDLLFINDIKNASSIFTYNLPLFQGVGDDIENHEKYATYFAELPCPPLLYLDSYVINAVDEDVPQKVAAMTGGGVCCGKRNWMLSKGEVLDYFETHFKTMKIYEEGTQALEDMSFECDLDDILEAKKQKGIPFTGGNESEVLSEKAFAGLKRRRVDTEEHRKRVSYELGVLNEGKVSAYFLLLEEIVGFCEANGIFIGIGRGSAGGSLVSYALGITNVDPLKYGLIFERFLNSGRLTKGEMPDIDIDIQAERRDEVLDFLRESYGGNVVCKVGAFSSYKLRNTFGNLLRLIWGSTAKIREVTKRLKPHEYVKGVKKVGAYHWSDVFRNYYTFPELKRTVDKNPHLIYDMAAITESVYSQTIHACAILILNESKVTSAEKILPVRKVGGYYVTEWDGEELARLGFLKIDLLSLAQLDKFADVQKLIQEKTGEEVHFAELATDDKKVFQSFGKGYTGDVCHFGKPLATKYLRELKPDAIQDLIDTIALLRPGPMGSNEHIAYQRRRRGDEAVRYDLDCDEFKRIVKNTYGLLIYQEQVMQIMVEVAGFSLEEADEVRKAMGKGVDKLLREKKGKFMKSLLGRFGEEELLGLWNKMVAFSGYAFNKSHAVCYALTGYACQWFKVNYPECFWQVAFNHAASSDIAALAKEAEESGMRIVPPDVNISDANKAVEREGKIFLSLRSIKGISDRRAEHIVEVRQAGAYSSLSDMVARVSDRLINKEVVKRLFHGGGFDECFGRKSAGMMYDRFCGHSLFGDGKQEGEGVLRQLEELIGLKIFNFPAFLRDSTLISEKFPYISLDSLQEYEEGKQGAFAGRIREVREVRGQYVFGFQEFGSVASIVADRLPGFKVGDVVLMRGRIEKASFIRKKVVTPLENEAFKRFAP